MKADFLADGFRERLEDLLVSQKNGPDLSKLGLDAREPLIGSGR
jgi:hypothetical protein